MNQNTRQQATLAGWIVCALGAIFYCYEYLLRIQPSVMSTELMQYFDISYQGFGFLAGFYYFAYTPMQLVVGVITDIFGPRRILTIAVALCALGSYLFSFPHSHYIGPAGHFYIACAGRFLIGFGSAFAFVGVLKLAVIWLPSDRFALFSGLATALGMVGAMVGDTELTRLVQTIGWRDTIYLSAAFGIILVPLLWFIIEDGHKSFREAFKQKAMALDVLRGLGTVAKNSQIWLAGLVACFFYLSLAVFAETWGVQFLSNAYDLSRDASANLNAAVFGGWLVGGPIAGLVSDVLKTRRIPLFVGGVIAAFIIGFVIFYPYLSPWPLWIMLFAYGVFSSVQVICFSLGRENAHALSSGTAIAFINMLTMISGMIFQPFIGMLIEWGETGFLQPVARQLGVSAYQIALFILPLGGLIIIILLSLLKETYAEPVFKESTQPVETS